MLVRDLIRISFHNLLLHKIRSFLTSLGIIFGVGSVISMLAISEGAKEKSLAQIEAMGIDNIIIYTKEPPIAGKDSTSNSKVSVMKKYGITIRDLQNAKKMDNISRITTIRNARKKVMRGTTRLDVMLVATQPAFLQDSYSRIINGRWLTAVDERNRSLVCVIGKNVKKKLFSLGTQSVIGTNIRIESSLFKVVGVLENDLDTKIANLNTPNNMIYIPWATSYALYAYDSFQREGRADLKITHIEADVLIVKIKDLASVDYTAKRIKRYFEKTHRDSNDWEILVPYDLYLQREHTQKIFAIVMSSIAGISLLVGGVGIMNIMLANVYERRKEIGTRRALGAKKNDILFQFLLETVFLTLSGGVLGICFGLGISQLVAHYAEWPTVFTLWSILLSVIISGLAGIIFGTYPAWQAAQQNPIDVLRSE